MSSNKPPSKEPSSSKKPSSQPSWVHPSFENVKIAKTWNYQESREIVRNPSALGTDKTSRTLDEDQLEDEWDYYHVLWDKSKNDEKLSKVFEEEHKHFENLKITQCICIGIGQFAQQTLIPVNSASSPIKAKMATEFNKGKTHHSLMSESMHQLLFFNKVVTLLGKKHQIENVYIQEPSFEERVEERFAVNKLNYKLLQAADGKRRKKDQAQDRLKRNPGSTFLFCPSFEIELLATWLETGWPALYVGPRVDKPASETFSNHEQITKSMRAFFEGTDGVPMFDLDTAPWAGETAATIRWTKGKG